MLMSRSAPDYLGIGVGSTTSRSQWGWIWGGEASATLCTVLPDSQMCLMDHFRQYRAGARVLHWPKCGGGGVDLHPKMFPHIFRYFFLFSQEMQHRYLGQILNTLSPCRRHNWVDPNYAHPLGKAAQIRAFFKKNPSASLPFNNCFPWDGLLWEFIKLPRGFLMPAPICRTRSRLCT